MDLPFSQISKEKDNYSSVNIISRLIEGVGYRYYWASNNLRLEDLNFKPTPNSISTYQTLEHIYVLSLTVKNTLLNKINIRPPDNIPKSYDDLRKKTLKNLELFNKNILKENEIDLNMFKIIFERNDFKSSFPFWNLLNGPIADIIYHTGQIVSFRRSSGNPINKGVNVFLGRTKK